MVHFHPPGRSGDFARSARAEELAQGWDAIVDSWLTRAVETSDGLFFNPAAPDAPAGEPVPIVWDAFPLVITSWFDGQPDGDRLTFEAADALRPLRYSGRPLRAVRDGRLAEDLEVFHRQQDEYCEWFVERRDDGGIARVWFTGEGPEYWEFLASGTAPFFDEGDPRRDLTPGDPDLLLALYREHVSPAVELADLFWQHDVAAFSGGGWVYYARAGDYNALNRWTTTHGLMHLTHPANSLAARRRAGVGRHGAPHGGLGRGVVRLLRGLRRGEPVERPADRVRRQPGRPRRSGRRAGRSGGPLHRRAQHRRPRRSRRCGR